MRLTSLKSLLRTGQSTPSTAPTAQTAATPAASPLPARRTTANGAAQRPRGGQQKLRKLPASQRLMAQEMAQAGVPTDHIIGTAIQAGYQSPLYANERNELLPPGAELKGSLNPANWMRRMELKQEKHGDTLVGDLLGAARVFVAAPAGIAKAVEMFRESRQPKEAREPFTKEYGEFRKARYRAATPEREHQRIINEIQRFGYLVPERETPLKHMPDPRYFPDHYPGLLRVGEGPSQRLVVPREGVGVPNPTIGPDWEQANRAAAAAARNAWPHPLGSHPPTQE